MREELRGTKKSRPSSGELQGERHPLKAPTERRHRGGVLATPSGNSLPASFATSWARRVLPTPPTPVSVISRTSGRRRRSVTSPRSCPRPTSEVGAIGRTDPRAIFEGAGAVALRLGTDARRDARSSPESFSASASEHTVCGYGRRRSPRSRSLMPLALRPALSANSSCVSPAASLNRRSRVPNEASCLSISPGFRPLS